MPSSVDRPYMPGYGVQAPTSGTGLLDWTEAQTRLATSRNYWMATVWPDGRPHVMPVWGVWLDGAFWCSSSLRSRKTRNLRADPRCTITGDDADNPVVVEGIGEIVTDMSAIASFITAGNEKYEAGYDLEFLDPTVNATMRITPVWAFALHHDDFTGSPTRWRFGPSDGVGAAPA